MIAADILQPLIDAANWIIKLFAEGVSPVPDVGLSWGAAIVALTFVTRLLILPLSIKQIRSMRALQTLQPQLKEIQERYKDDKERQQREMIGFYREHGINPLASCWPLLLQLPVFFALYQLLRGSDFRDEVTATVTEGTNTFSFLFVNNILVKPDGVELVLLIVLFIVTQLAAGLVMATRLEGPQKYIMYAFPILIAPFIITQPAGLAIYWISTNIWTLGQQYVVKRFMPAPEIPTPEEVAKTKAPPPPPRKKKRRR